MSQREEAATATLSLRNVSKAFGGLVAVRDCTFDIESGCITAIVGPNGAGKSTVFNLITGFIRPDAGEIIMAGENLVGMTPRKVFQRGIARTFQGVRIFEGLTSLENLLMAGTSVQALPLLVRPRAAKQAETKNLRKAWQVINEIGLVDSANKPAGELGFAEQKLLAIGRLMMTDVTVLLLDEPLGGLDNRAVDGFVERLRNLVTSGNRTVCVVEHNLDAVRRIADRVVFMANGEVAASGDVNEVLEREDLTRLYLGVVATKGES